MKKIVSIICLLVLITPSYIYASIKDVTLIFKEGTAKIIGDDTIEKKGFYNSDEPLEIYLDNFKEAVKGAKYTLEYSFNESNGYQTVFYYDGIIEPKGTIKVRYADLLTDATNKSDEYINRLGVNVYFRIIKNSNSVSNESENETFVIQPKMKHFIYRTSDNTTVTSFHIGIIPENFRDLDWSKIFELSCTPFDENGTPAQGENFNLIKNGDVYEVQIKNTENNFSIDGTLKIECQIQAKNETSISQEINPNSFTINQSDIPATPNAASISYNPPTAPTLLMVVVV